MSGRGIIEQLIDHLAASPLRGGKIAGLPRAWFNGSEQSQAANSQPLQPEFQPKTVQAEPVRPMTLQPSAEQPESAEPSNGAAAAAPPTGGQYFQDFNLDQLRQAALGCTRCRLCETRNKVVFGVGKTDSPLIAFVGEGPGADEDRLGEPFVGRAGELLTAAITKGLGLRREDVYIANVVKCRPPQNRAPLPDEVQACTQFLYRQLQLINPKVIVTLGQPAQLALSGVNLGITRLRGQWQNWNGFKLMPTFHPAYLLRNPAAKKEFWQDLKAVMAELGINRG